MKRLIRTLTVLLAFSPAAVSQTSDVVQIERRSDSAILSVNTFRPLDAIATKLQSQFGIVVSAEDPIFQFRGDMMERFRPKFPGVRPGCSCAGCDGDLRCGSRSIRMARRKMYARFWQPLSPRPISGRLLRTDSMRLAAHSSSCQRKPVTLGGSPIAMTPLARPTGHDTGWRQANTRKRVSDGRRSFAANRPASKLLSVCRLPAIHGEWRTVMFAANSEPARSVLMRLGLNHWHMRCDDKFCNIDMR